MKLFGIRRPDALEFMCARRHTGFISQRLLDQLDHWENCRFDAVVAEGLNDP